MDLGIRTVPFAGLRDVRTAATWGQRTTWQDVCFFADRPQWWFVLKRRVEVPAGLDLDAVLAAIGELVARHEATRTLLESPGGVLHQHVTGSGALPVALLTCARADLDAALDEYRRGEMARPVDHATELPLRVLIALCDGAPAAVLLGISHVVADVHSVNLLASQLGSLLSAALAGEPPPAPRPCWQPADLADAEQGDAGRAWTESALGHLREQLDRIPASMFGQPGPAPAPRYQAATLTSDTLADAVRAAAQRYRVGSSAVFQAASAALLRELIGTPEVTFELQSANRADRKLRHAVGNLSQSALATLVVADGSFGELAATAGDTALAAHRRAHYDPAARDTLIRRVQAERGCEFDLGCRFNDMWSAQPSGPVPDPAADRSAAPPGTVTWDKGSDLDKLTFFVEVFGPSRQPRIKVLADAARLPAPMLPRFLLGLEAGLRAAADEELTVAEFVRRAFAAGG